MRIRKKLFIISPVILVSILIAFFFPQVFLIFHLDKYETSEACDFIKGEWNWYNNSCKIDSDYNSKICEDIGGIPSCSSRCVDRVELSPINAIFSSSCFSQCDFDTCEFEDPNLIKLNPKKELTDIVFNSHKLRELGWIAYPGGTGYMPLADSTLSLMYKDAKIGGTPLDFEKMLDDKIFVDKCESNNGIWNYTYHDCHIDYYVSCEDIGGISIGRSISDCTGNGVCLDRAIYLNTCVFEYNGE